MFNLTSVQMEKPPSVSLSRDMPAVELFRVSSVKRHVIRNEIRDPRLNVIASSRISTTHGRRFLIPHKTLRVPILLGVYPEYLPGLHDFSYT